MKQYSHVLVFSPTFDLLLCLVEYDGTLRSVAVPSGRVLPGSSPLQAGVHAVNHAFNLQVTKDHLLFFHYERDYSNVVSRWYLIQTSPESWLDLKKRIAANPRASIFSLEFLGLRNKLSYLAYMGRHYALNPDQRYLEG